MKTINSLALSQANRRLFPLRKIKDDLKVRPGWIKYTRVVLGMGLKELAKRAQVSLSSVAQAERQEARGNIEIKTLKRMAEAMDCEFVYAFVPRTDFEKLIENAALQKAKALVRRADMHMTLEDQKVASDLEDRINHIALGLIESGDVW